MKNNEKVLYCNKKNIDCYKCEFYTIDGCSISDDYKKILNEILTDKEEK